MASSYTITVDDAPVPTITVDATGVLHRDRVVYLDAAVQAALLAFIETLTDEPSVVVWENAQPDWHESERVQ